MDRVTSMAVFVRSVEGGSLAAAARHFGLSHAMVSKHLRGLEQSLGVRLLTLTTRRLTLTEAGDSYFRRCVQILADIEEANREAMQLQAVPRGLLRLTAPVTFGEQHLAPALAAFLARYPEIVLDVELTDRFSHLIDEGFDLALRIGRLPDSSLVARRLGASRMLTCAAPAYLARHGTPAHPSDLARHRCLYLNGVTTPGEWWYEVEGSRLAVRVDGPLRTNSMALACQAAREGAGIVFGPAFALEPWIATGDLVPVLAGFDSGALDIHALYLSKRHMSKKLRLLIDFLAARFSRPVGTDGV
jgi:DNA-binding transcriptional LysR family regulator